MFIVEGPKFLNLNAARTLTIDLYGFCKAYADCVNEELEFAYYGETGLGFLPVVFHKLGWCKTILCTNRFDLTAHEKFSTELGGEAEYSINLIKEALGGFRKDDVVDPGTCLCVSYKRLSKDLSKLHRDMSLVPKSPEEALALWNFIPEFS